MSSFEEQKLKKLENALAALTPRPAVLNRDQLVFEAGRRSVQPSRLWFWTTLGVSALASLLVVGLVSRSNPERVVQFVEVPAKPASPGDAQVAPVPEVPTPEEDNTLPPSSFGNMRRTALSVGIDQMPMTDGDRPQDLRLTNEPVPTVGSRGVLAIIRVTGDN